MVNRSGRKILLVDDEPSLRDILKDDFEEMGFQIVEAADGKEGLECFRKYHASIRLIVTDIKMPVMDGYQMVIELFEGYTMLPPVVMMSGFSDHNERQILKLGVKKVYRKPLELDSFFREVADLIDE